MLNLNKAAATVLNLSKDMGIEGLQAKVKFVADYSISMEDLYKDGVVQRIMERLVPVAMIFDPTKELELYLFSSGAYKVPGAISANNIAGFMKKAVQGTRMGGTDYAPIIDMIAGENQHFTTKSVPRSKTVKKPSSSFLGRLFGFTTEETVNYNDNIRVPVDGGAEIPTLVIFITDGDNSDKEAARVAITKASRQPIFFQFVGIKSNSNCDFKFLNELDTMEGRHIDNANFFEITTEDLTDTSDEELYDRILSEFGREYIPLARSPKYQLIA